MFDHRLIGSNRSTRRWFAQAEARGALEPNDNPSSAIHGVDSARFLVILRGNADLGEALATPRLQRAIGVIYRPETERQSHYFRARVARQFDALIHLDATRALVPLDRPRDVGVVAVEPPETFPSGV